MALLDNFEQFVKDNTADGSWTRPNLRERCGDFIEEEGITAPTGTISITENGTVDVAQYASADVEVSGGSSRFSLASVAITANSGESGACLTLNGANGASEGCAFLVDVDDYSALITSIEISQGETGTFQALLIDGEAWFDVGGENLVVTGGATIEDDVIIITGDCTLTADPVIPK